MRWQRWKVEENRALLAMVLFYVIVQALDFLTTEIGQLQGFREGNPLMRDPHSYFFLPLRALQVKAVGLLYYVLLPAAVIHAAFRWAALTGLPFAWSALHLLPVVATNTALLLWG